MNNSAPNPMNNYVAMYYLSNGTIEVDDEGRIWRMRSKNNGARQWRNITPRSAEDKHPSGYLQVQLRFNNKRYNVLSHRIVYLALKGIIPKGLEINHKNGIKDDNRPENIELATRSENMKHRHTTLGLKLEGIRGEKNSMAKIKEQDVRDIRNTYAKGGISQEKLGKIYGLSQKAIYFIIHRINWKHVT